MQDSKIEWCDHTHNSWVGCEKVSPGCDNCYAESWATRYRDVAWGAPRRRTSDSTWHKPIVWNRLARERGVAARVFSASLSDWCDNQVPPSWRIDLLRLIESTPHLVWMLLTKRPQNIRKLVIEAVTTGPSMPWLARWVRGKPPPNVWLGCTAENQEEADRRIPHLVDMPAVVHFLSVEPMLAPVDLPLRLHPTLRWVICGGETGARARMMNPAWARDLRDQCAAAGVAFFMKQMTAKGPIPGDLMVRQSPSAPVFLAAQSAGGA